MSFCRMHAVVWCLLLALNCVGSDKSVAKFNFNAESNPQDVAERGCLHSIVSCPYLARPQVELRMHEMYERPLKDWKYCHFCKSFMPPQEPLPFLQHFHIPKTGGTAFVRWLRDYAGCPPLPADGFPCAESISMLDTDSMAQSLLCNGRLLACAGHRTHPDTYRALMQDHTNAVTLLRHPWSRLQSDMHYTLSKPHSMHLAPEVNTTLLLASVPAADTRPRCVAAAFEDSEHGTERLLQCQQEQRLWDVQRVVAYARYPGMLGCATKMLNGFQCGEVLGKGELGGQSEGWRAVEGVTVEGEGEGVGDDEFAHTVDMDVLLHRAKRALNSMAFVGLSEHFERSLCLFAYMYGTGWGAAAGAATGTGTGTGEDWQKEQVASEEEVEEEEEEGKYVSVRPHHVQKTREGSYDFIDWRYLTALRIDEPSATRPEDDSGRSGGYAMRIGELVDEFRYLERHDIELYRFACEDIFLVRLRQSTLLGVDAAAQGQGQGQGQQRHGICDLLL